MSLQHLTTRHTHYAAFEHKTDLVYGQVLSSKEATRWSLVIECAMSMQTSHGLVMLFLCVPLIF